MTPVLIAVTKEMVLNHLKCEMIISLFAMAALCIGYTIFWLIVKLKDKK